MRIFEIDVAVLTGCSLGTVGGSVIRSPRQHARRRHFEAERTRRGRNARLRMGDARIESLARSYERPALRKPFAAFPADSKVA